MDHRFNLMTRNINRLSGHTFETRGGKITPSYCVWRAPSDAVLCVSSQSEVQATHIEAEVQVVVNNNVHEATWKCKPNYPCDNARHGDAAETRE